ncbi:TetR/AcrR family transcriptional regulator [Flammeovirga pectinis]|uniref:TetR/AcrR family transcriptional regulator n=1 Tax=Flammeovirga pectinis TaxID=2494373 RepID=A0A3S9NYY8_9BACT|nr:TetR/AcrR family transcriptional regulator [Flammeovirga pectinis]AZQ61075.1 TetR/AcrR family transcriptional regulator [Flammeovirga pectinis]
MSKSTKEHIIEVALQLFKTKGMNNISLNDVVKASSVSKGALYHHFKNKDELLIACLLSFWKNQSETWIEVPFEEMSLLDVINLLKVETANSIENFTSDHDNSFEFYITTLFSVRKYPQIQEFSKGFFNHFKNGIEKVIKNDQKAGIIKKEIIPSDLAQLIIATGEGLGVLSFAQIYDIPKDIFNNVYNQIYKSVTY